jgi:serine/threonine-protein kinase SRPK3
MVAILSDPPPEFLEGSKKSAKYWDRNGESRTNPCFTARVRPNIFTLGKWIHEVAIPSINLENYEQRLSGEDKKSFLTFMRKMLHWKPEDRSGWQDIFFDEWLLADLIESGEIVRDG